MSVKREKWPWKATVTVSVGPLRCLATIRSACGFSVRPSDPVTPTASPDAAAT
jgi:hypothetical protein